MKYTLKKIFIVGICSIFVLIGSGLLLVSLEEGEVGVGALLGAVFMSLGLFQMISGVRLINKFQKKTYLWYKATHPLNVDGNRVTCFSCGSPRINVRALMNRTYHRDHFCTQCGTSLYFSPEGK